MVLYLFIHSINFFLNTFCVSGNMLDIMYIIKMGEKNPQSLPHTVHQRQTWKQRCD